jgi:GxxExxY protein
MKSSKYSDMGSEMTKVVIGAAIAVHKALGPGLDEADYEMALHLELLERGIEHDCQVALPVVYKGVRLECGYRMDLVVSGGLLLELKVADKLHPLHEAQLLTYLKLSKMALGLLMNFNVVLLREGIVRRVQTIAHQEVPIVSMPPIHGFDALSEEVVSAALEVQHVLGPGLLRSAYEACLAHELGLRGVKVERGLPANVRYRESLFPSNKQIPMIVEGQVLVACHCVSELKPLHLARDRSLLKVAAVETGLSMNFHAESFGAEIRRIRGVA